MTLRELFIFCIVGAVAVLTILAGLLLWWLAHAKVNTRGVVGNEHQLDTLATRDNRKLRRLIRGMRRALEKSTDRTKGPSR